MRAIILAGGKGIRLRPFTTLIPKPLVPVGEKYSILEIIIMQLKRDGFNHITLAVNHLSHLIMAYFGDGSRWGVNLDYSIEEEELSTIAPLSLIKDLPHDFLVMNGDVLCDLNFKLFFNSHISSNADVTVCTAIRKYKIDFGTFEFDGNKNVIGFKEKPEYFYHAAAGIYCINKKIKNDLLVGVRYGFDDLMNDALKGRYKINTFSHNGFWSDIGKPADYDYVNENFIDIENNLLKNIF